MMHVLPAVWMMTMYLAGRFILGQWVSLASHADRGIMLEQADEADKKTWMCGLVVATHVNHLTTEHPHALWAS